MEENNQIWSFNASGNESLFAGNYGYADKEKDNFEKLYEYDNFVPNHKRVKKDDFVVVRDKKYLLGLARIKRIESREGEKIRRRCPKCNHPNIKHRIKKTPEFRCQNTKCKNEFDVGTEEVVDCTIYTAYYDGTFIAISDEGEEKITKEILKKCHLKDDIQNSIRELDFQLTKDILLENTKKIRKSLFNNGNFNHIEIDDIEGEENKNNSIFISYNLTTKYYDELVFSHILARRGQGRFRKALLECYGERCMITDCKLIDIIEAAHILPYSISNNNHPENGLLLRTDLHTLFDLDFLGIDPESLKVYFHPTAIDAGYKNWQGKTLLCSNLKPNKEALESRWRRFLDRKNGVIL